MNRIFRALTFTVLIGGCTLSGSSFDGGADFGDSVSFDGGVLDGSQLSDKTDLNVFQHPFLLTPIELETAEGDNMTRQPVREQLPFQHPFIVKPHGVPEENAAVYVVGDSVPLQSDASDEPSSLGN